MDPKRAAAEIIGLSTSRGRLLFFAGASIIIFLLPVRTLAGFSLWNRMDIPSPSIGLTRAYHYVLHGDFALAWQQNSLIFVVLIIGLPIIAKDVYTVLKLKKGTIRNGRTKQPKPTAAYPTDHTTG